MDLDITFVGKTMTTPVYIKLDAEEQLLLSEGVSRKLGINQYTIVMLSPGETTRRFLQSLQKGSCMSTDSPEAAVVVPTISIELVQLLRLPPGQCGVVPV